MDSSKNKRIKKQRKEILCEIDNIDDDARERLAIVKSKRLTRRWHLLKNSRVKLHKLKFVSNDLDRFFEALRLKDESSSVLSRRYFTNQVGDFWVNQKEIINWLRAQGFIVKYTPSKEYQINAKTYSDRAMILFVNRERIKRGLKPFLIPELIEY